MTEGNKLTLYQDADTPELPVFDGVTSPNGDQYIPTRAWRDLYDAILTAQKFIYITGISRLFNFSNLTIRQLSYFGKRLFSASTILNVCTALLVNTRFINDTGNMVKSVNDLMLIEYLVMCNVDYLVMFSFYRMEREYEYQLFTG